MHAPRLSPNTATSSYPEQVQQVPVVCCWGNTACGDRDFDCPADQQLETALRQAEQIVKELTS
jgi:hypothetical protein